MSGMFYGCDSLNFLDISNFNMINCNSYDNMFSNINNISYINLYNFKNDKIISKIFNDTETMIYVCQKHNPIIKNPKTFECCSYNFTISVCNVDDDINKSDSDKPDTSDISDKKNISDEPDEPDESDESDESDELDESGKSDKSDIYIIFHDSSKNSNKMSIAVISSIIVGVMVIIGITILIICFCKKKKHINNQPFESSPSEINLNKPDKTDISMDSKRKENESLFEKQNTIIEYEPDVKKQKITIFFQASSQSVNINIKIDPDKTVRELIKFYFKVINKPDLFNDKSIIFLFYGSAVSKESEELIKNLLTKNVGTLTFLVMDLDNKI